MSTLRCRYQRVISQANLETGCKADYAALGPFSYICFDSRNIHAHDSPHFYRGLCTDFGTDLARCRYWSGSFRLLDIGAKESNRSPLCLLWMGGGLELEKFSGRTSWPSNCCDCRRRDLLFRGSNCVRDEGAGSMAKGVRIPRNFSRAYCAGCRVPLLCGLGTGL